MKKEKKMIKKAIDYLRSVSIKEPIKYQVEEIGKDRIVLSYVEKGKEYFWQDRIYKEFNFKNNQVFSMKKFKYEEK